MNTTSFTFDSVIFDLDGTLWDATGTVAEAWQKAIDQVDYVKDNMTQEKVRSITGMTYDAIYQKLYPYLTEEQSKEFKALCAKEEIDHMNQHSGTLYEGLEETLQYLKGKYRLFIVSNCQSGYIETFIKHSGLGAYFEDHECYGSRNLPKAENIKEIVRRNNLKAPVYVGDTMGDYTAAKGAEVPFIFCSYGFGTVEEGQIATLSKFTDLQEVL